MKGWFKFVSYGGAMVRAYPTNWPRGPWKSEQEGEEAWNRWVERHNLEDMADAIRTAHNIRLVGPFPTREIARKADISDYDRYLTR